MSIQIGDLSKQVAAQSGATFDFHPFHDPLVTCYGHSLIYSCFTGEIPPTYNPPPKDVINALRQQIYARQVIEIEPSHPKEFPLPLNFGYRNVPGPHASIAEVGSAEVAAAEPDQVRSEENRPD
jgi:hypothetical protein